MLAVEQRSLLEYRLHGTQSTNNAKTGCEEDCCNTKAQIWLVETKLEVRQPKEESNESLELQTSEVVSRVAPVRAERACGHFAKLKDQSMVSVKTI